MPLFESFDAVPMHAEVSNLLDITRTTLATLGAIYMTATARGLLKAAGLNPVAIAVAHAHGLWGSQVDAYEARLNDIAMVCGGPLRSIYSTDGKSSNAVWVLSEPKDAQGLRPGTLICAAWEYSRGLDEGGD